MILLLLALLQAPPPKPAAEPSLFDKPQFVEGKFEATVDSGAHASAGSATRSTIPPIGILRLPALRPSNSTHAQAKADHDQALTLEANRQPIQAATYFARAVQLDPSPQHVFDAAVHLLAHGAAHQASRLLQSHPKDPNLQLALGLAQYALTQYEAARVSFLAVLKESPADPRPFDALALLVEISPALADSLVEPLAPSPLHQALALLRGSKPSSERAESLLRKAIAQDPRSDQPHFELARFYLDQQKNGEALAELQATIEVNPNHELAHFRLAQLYQRRQSKAEAEKHFSTYRRLHAQRLESEEAERKSRILLSEVPGK